MHIHTASATPMGDSLAGFQAAQTATALRRARELSDAGARLRARSSAGAGEEDTVSFASLMAANPAAQSQTIASVSARENGERAPEQRQDQPWQDQPWQDLPPAPMESSASQPGVARPDSEQLELRIAMHPGGRGSGFEGSNFSQSNFSQSNFSQSASISTQHEPSRASPNSLGKSGDSSNDWLRPVSFWA